MVPRPPPLKERILNVGALLVALPKYDPALPVLNTVHRSDHDEEGSQ